MQITNFKRRQRGHEAPHRLSQLEALLDSLGQGVSIFDSGLKLSAFNRRYAELYDYPADLVQIGVPYEVILRFNGERRQLAGDALASYIAERLTRAHEWATKPHRFEHLSPNGRVIEVHRGPFTDGGFISTYTDITERREAEEAAKRNAELLNSTIEHMADGIRVFDKDLKLVVSNRKALDMFHQPPELGRVGTRYEEFVKYNETHGHYGADTMAESTDSRLGRAKQFINRKTPYFSPDGRVIEKWRDPMPDGGFVATYRDVTGLFRAQQMLAEEKERAEHANRSKSQFLANMSHELRTPLNAIIGFSEMMHRQMLGPLGNPSYGDYARSILDSGQHLLAIINDILDLSKIEAGKAEPSDEVVDVGEVARSCLRLMEEPAGRKNLTLRGDLPEDRLHLRGDARMIKQIMLNLLSNAIKFTAEGGAITLSAAAVDDLALTIADTGIGIAAEDIEKALTPFVQVDSSLSRKYEGTGLGLPLARSFARLHGGDLRITSEVGVGTTVLVTFPRERVIVSSAAD